MDLTYFKRYRMELKVTDRDLTPGPLPAHYRVIPWNPAYFNAFAEAKFQSFRDELDANVFPCFSDLEGCRRLMREIVRKPGFLAETTWLLAFAPRAGRPEYCGTVQGIRDMAGVGAIQNLGVAPEHRNAGLGTILLCHSLQGFRRAGIKRVYLEVTAQNDGAVRLYERVGFVTVKTVYKAVEPVYS